MSARITTIQKALPKYKISQATALRYMIDKNHLTNSESHDLEVLYRATGIDSRYSVLSDYACIEDNSFFNKEKSIPTISQRLFKYNVEAINLSVESAKKCLDQRSLDPNQIDHLIYVSCTGMQAPGIDIQLVNELGLRKNTHRTAINFMGCYAAFTALKLAKNICNSSNSKVLIVCTELCTIHFQEGKEEDYLLANALFGDGSAAVLVESDYKNTSLIIEDSFCDLLVNGEKEMAWRIGELGFEMKLSAYVPNIIDGGINNLLSNFNSEFDYYAIHPGGKKILSVIEEALGISKKENHWAHSILRNYGNMSSPTVLYVLSSIFENLKLSDDGKSILAMAFGPGITLESMTFKIDFNA